MAQSFAVTRAFICLNFFQNGVAGLDLYGVTISSLANRDKITFKTCNGKAFIYRFVTSRECLWNSDITKRSINFEDNKTTGVQAYFEKQICKL